MSDSQDKWKDHCLNYENIERVCANDIEEHFAAIHFGHCQQTWEHGEGSDCIKKKFFFDRISIHRIRPQSTFFQVIQHSSN